MIFSSPFEPRNIPAPEVKLFTDRQIFNLLYPVLIEQFLSLLVGIADSMMVSYAGVSAVSAVTLVNQLNAVFLFLFTALSSGGAVVVSQYIGNKDRTSSNLSASQLLTLSVIVSVILTFLTLIFKNTIFSFLFGKVEKQVFDDGILYLTITAWSLVFVALYSSASAVFRSMSKTKTVMVISIIMNIINVAGNYIGIFILHAGVKGVAYPTFISRAFAGLVLAYLAFNRHNSVYLSFKNIFVLVKDMQKRIIRIALPNSIESSLFQFSKVAVSTLVALFGTNQIAANGVAQTFWGMSALFTIAIGPVYITVAGQCMGAQDIKSAEYYIQKLLRINIFGAILWNIIFLAVTPALLSLFDLPPSVVKLTLIIIVLHNSFNGILAPYSFGLSNALRAAGDVRFTMYASIFSTVICRVAFSVLFGLYLNMGVIGITIAMVLDWAVKSVLDIIRYRSKKWQHFKVI